MIDVPYVVRRSLVMVSGGCSTTTIAVILFVFRGGVMDDHAFFSNNLESNGMSRHLAFLFDGEIDSPVKDRPGRDRTTSRGVDLQADRHGRISHCCCYVLVVETTLERSVVVFIR